MIQAAFKSPLSGNITVGNNHFEAFALSDVPTIDAITDSQFLAAEGFVVDGIFYTREETYALTGIYCVEHLSENERIKNCIKNT